MDLLASALLDFVLVDFLYPHPCPYTKYPTKN